MTWAERAANASRLGAVLDPADADGAKNAYIDALHAHVVGRLLRKAGPYAHALDFGCGTGRFLPRLARFARVVSGVDRTSEMLALARAHSPNADLALCSAGDLPFAAASFDLTLCVYVLSMLDAAEFDAAMAQIARVNAPGGTLIAIEQLDNGRALDEEAYRSRFLRHGFHIASMHPVRDGSGSGWMTLARRFRFAIPLFARIEAAQMHGRRHGAQTPGYFDYAIVARKNAAG